MNIHLLLTLVFTVAVALSGSLQRAMALLLLGVIAVAVPVIVAWLAQIGSRIE